MGKKYLKPGGESKDISFRRHLSIPEILVYLQGMEFSPEVPP